MWRGPALSEAEGAPARESLQTGKSPQDSKESAGFVESYALTTLPLRRQEVQTRMCLVAAPTLA